MLKALSVNQLLEKTKNKKLSSLNNLLIQSQNLIKKLPNLSTATYIFILMSCHMTTYPLPI
ncbi:hypothetical protein B4129_1809 [Bacillus safensis]|nr:hypothetical protein B4129_1809 [Bacillus safensis]